MNTITGRSAFLTLLKDEGVTHMFGNPGTTELPIMHALSEHTDLTYVLGLQESIVVAMADGFGRASGKLTACNVHVAPGLGNAMGSIYNAMFTGTPIIITAGQQEQGHGLTEPLLYAPLVPIATPLVKWATEITRLEDMPRIIRRAAKVAMTPPTGPVFLSLPGDVLNGEAAVDIGHRTRVDTASRPSDATLDALARRILAADRPAIISGDEIVSSDALAEVAELAETIGAPAYQQTVTWGAHFPSEHRAYMGALTRNQAEVRETLRVLVPALAARGGPELAARAEARLAAIAEHNWSAKRAARRESTRAAAEATPIANDWLMMQITDALPANGVVVNEGLTAAWQLLDYLPYRDRWSYHANASGGIGWAIGAAIGVQLALPERPLVAIIGDGSAMYSIQALWTAAHLKLPITYVIANNKGYRILKQRLQAFHGNDNFIGMSIDEPEIDFVALARSLGMSAEAVTAPDAVRPALDAAIASGKPTLLDVAVETSI